MQNFTKLDHAIDTWAGFSTGSRLRHDPVATLKGGWTRFARWRRVSRPRAVNTPWGHKFYGVFPEAITSQLWRLKLYDQRGTKFLRHNLKPGQCFVDVGAHFGYFTLLASWLVGDAGKVVAVEPIPKSYARLAENVERNHLGNVRTLRVAASDKAGDITLKSFGEVYSTLNTSGEPREHVPAHIKPEYIVAPAIALDSELFATVVHMVKIDIEGAELKALHGMQQMLARDRPIVLVECGGMADDVDEPERVRDIFAFMATLGYVGHESDGRNLKRITPDTKDPKRNDVVFTHQAVRSSVTR